MAEYLVEIGIDSISLEPDAVLKTTLNVLEIEKRLGRQPRNDSTSKSDPGALCFRRTGKRSPVIAGILLRVFYRRGGFLNPPASGPV
jgi:hypothetical protein